MSKLYFRYGAMNSGKSTNLMQVAHNYEERGMNVVLIKPATDKKGGDKLVSRLGVERKVDLVIANKGKIAPNLAKKYDTTITGYLCGVYMYSLYKAYIENKNTKNSKRRYIWKKRRNQRRNKRRSVCG